MEDAVEPSDGHVHDRRAVLVHLIRVQGRVIDESQIDDRSVFCRMHDEVGSPLIEGATEHRYVRHIMIEVQNTRHLTSLVSGSGHSASHSYSHRVGRRILAGYQW